MKDEVRCPERYIGPDGKLLKFVPNMDTSQGQVHLLCPSGIGDVAWIWSKLWKVHEDFLEQGRELIWHFPETGSNRVDPYARAVGMKVGEYISGMPDFRPFPGEPSPEDFETGCKMYVHANVHIENALPLHLGSPVARLAPKLDDGDDRGALASGEEFSHLWSKDALEKPHWDGLREKVEEYKTVSDPLSLTWCSWLPFKNPALPVVDVSGKYRGPSWGSRNVVQRFEEADPYILVKPGPKGWMNQNWSERQYAKVIEKLEEIAPVMLMGYSPTQDVDMLDRILERYQNHGGYCIDQTYETALTAVVNCTAMLSIDDGMSIMGTYYGKDVFRMYPDWLEKMPGTFEDLETLHPNNSWCLIEDMKDGPLDKWMEGIRV